MKRLTIQRLRELLNYNPQTGQLTWKIKQSIRIQEGSVITGKMKQGHLRVSIDYKRYLAHRIAWFHYYGKWPNGRLDHKDGNPANNRISNLRECTHPQNLWNRNAQSNNLSSLKGVSFDTRRNTWFARIAVHGKQYWLGSFPSALEAHEAYITAAKKLHGEFARY